MPTLSGLARLRLEKLRPKSAAPAHVTEKTLDDLAEKYGNDFLGFCGLLQVVPKEGGERIPFVLSPTQLEIQRVRSPRMILCKGRQVRATTIEVARDLWWFLTKRGGRVIVVTQSAEKEAGVKDVVYKIDVFLDSLRQHGYVFEFGREQSSDWSLPTRDATLRVIQAGASEKAAATKGRGGTCNRLHMTEMALWGDYANETFNSLTKSMPENGSEIINETTPRGAYGFYFEQWSAAVAGTSAYVPHFFGWWLEPDYRRPLDEGETLEPLDDIERGLLRSGATLESVKWRRWAIKEAGGKEQLVNQEYPNDPQTCFLVAGVGFFDQTVTTSLITQSVRSTRLEIVRTSGGHGEARFFASADPTCSYVITADTSEGTFDTASIEGGAGGNDRSAAHVYERVTGRHMATLDGQFKPLVFAKQLAWLGREFGTALVAVERNNHGHAVLLALSAIEKYPRIFHDRDEKPGWLSHEVTRTPALDKLEEAHRSGLWKTKDAKILGEFRTFIVNRRGRAEGAHGSHDEHPICAAIGWDVLCRAVQTRSVRGISSL